MIINNLKIKVERVKLRKKLEKDNIIKGGVVFDKNTFLEGTNMICNNSCISGSSLGRCSYVGCDCYIPKTKIGRYCSIAQGVRVVMGNHPTSKFVSTHGAFYSKDFFVSYTKEQKFKEYSYADADEKFFVEIGNDVWVGSDVRILNGVKIGDGAVIAAGAVVVKDIEPYSVVGGVPAKHIKYRFNESQREFLQRIKWWDFDENEIVANADLFEDIDKFMQYYK
ncbi:MAG: CatB-related O-acetyltransferase [Clostridia bacterium]|nr:CatB-related O-acetyltransferase [Clostridia bacterium]